MKKSAHLSLDGEYRFWLAREWSEGGKRVCWIMLNPSTADAEVDDQTIRKIIKFSRREGFDALDVVNLFALRTPDPKMIKSHFKPVGGSAANDSWIMDTAVKADLVVCAWGAHGTYLRRDMQVLTMLRRHLPDRRIVCLGTNQAGSPKHPLYLRDDTPFVDFIR